MRRAVGVLLFILLTAAGTVYAKPEIVIDPGTIDPSALKPINEAVDAIARLAEDQDGGEADRLRRRARDAVLAALQTQGYFAAQVSLKEGTDVGGETWDIAIQAGTRAKVVGVELEFQGRITASEYAKRVETLRKDWLLPVGKPFINSDWNKAKSALLDGVDTRDFLLARVTDSYADVDAVSGTVRLKVVVDSGPLVRMGALQTEGLKRVPESLVTRYVRYMQGAPYDQDQLNKWQQELQSTSFFRGAFVSMRRPGGEDAGQADARSPSDPGPGHPKAGSPGAGNPGAGEPGAGDSASTPASDPRVTGGSRPAPPPVDSNGEITLPVQVRLVEAPPKRLGVSMGVDSDAGVRFETVYRQNVVFGQPITMETGLGVDRLRQRVYADFYLPPDVNGNKDSIGLLADHSDIKGLDVTRFAVGATRLQERSAGGGSRVGYETRYGLLAAHDHVIIDGGDTFDLPTLTATAEWLRRDVDSKYNPREGNLIAVGTGVGITLDKGQPYTRLRLRGQQWWPISKRDVLTVRGEVGKLWSDDNTQVPDDFGFRTGGARSIRGYQYLSIGQDRDNAVVGAATLLVGSIEYDHYFDERWGVGFFVDGGDAARSFGSMQMAMGYGVGARVRTPAGPLFLDVAYGQRDHAIRINFSLGIAF
jgi:translocation and assembly module TamA